MEKVIKILKKRIALPSLEEVVFVLRKMLLWEKLLFLFLAVSFAAASLSIIWKLNNNLMVDVPARSGSLTEGIIGTPRFINPVLAISDADRDLIALTYSGLLRPDNDGELIKDMAENYEISADGLTYTFTLKEKLYWPDGEPITADDVVFTIQRLKDPAMKSPKRGSWEGVEVEKTSDKTIRFSLKKPYAPFLENATIGIIPNHVWKDISVEQMASSEMNIKPMGSGPYKIAKIKRNSLGIIVSYELSANNNFALGKPNLKKIVLKFYPSEKELLSAYQKGEVESMNAITPQVLEKIKTENSEIKSLNLPRVFGVFFNQNSAQVLARKEVRQALNMAVDREKIIDRVFKGYGSGLAYALPQGTFGAIAPDLATGEEKAQVEKAKHLLEENGWKMNNEGKVLEKKAGKELYKLSFSISTSDSPELKETAYLLKEMWEEIGAKVEVKIFEIGDLNQSVIRPRKYETLLFGQIVGRDPDLFAFWHSSQRNDPGLNVALYANIKADRLLEEARATQDPAERSKQYEDFQKEVAGDIPAIFLFSPKFIYILPKSLKGDDDMENATVPSERFASIYKWHKETDKVWKIFAKETN
ncbi:peptide ABC transporter substrate-binding protein [Candidatus Parcubacteria bacterium]|nr:MAG: peptide ABC transporter substrate-binding protein [Candidatus Parcubacteria bacterium]